MNKLHLNKIDSTNNYLKQNYKNLEDYTFVSADLQTNGKGRNSREWKSENGKNLLFSLLLLDKQLFNHFKEISVITAYSIIEALSKIGIKGLSLKWPNDVYVNGKKICGILLESVSEDEMQCLIIGVGLNVNQTLFEGEYRVEPTSILNETKIKQDIEKIKEDIYITLLSNINSLKDGKNFYHLITKYDYLKDREVSLEIENVYKEAKVKGIQEDYSLLIESDGKLVNVYTGEVELIKIK